jgi:DNA replication protein DnaC
MSPLSSFALPRPDKVGRVPEPPAPRCALCGDSGFKYTPGSTFVSRCDCWKAKHDAHAPGVPREFHSSRFANYRRMKGNVDALDAAKAFLDGEGDLYLCGRVGCGKTRLAATVLNEANLRGIRGWFARVPMVLLKLQPSSGGDEEREQLTHKLETEPLLVLDELAGERDSASDYTRRTLLLLYEERSDKGHRTIWTSNVRLDKQAGAGYQSLGEYMKDDRLASRIGGRASVVWMNTSDQRVKKG